MPENMLVQALILFLLLILSDDFSAAGLIKKP